MAYSSEKIFLLHMKNTEKISLGLFENVVQNVCYLREIYAHFSIY